MRQVILCLLLTWVVSTTAFLSSTVIWGSSRINFPRLLFDPNTITGVALVNPNDQDAKVTLTAYGASGEILHASHFTNPVTVTVPAGCQFANTTLAMFGTAFSPETPAWFQAVSNLDNLTGFFLVLNSTIDYLDGTVPPELSRNLVISGIQAGRTAETELNLVNPNSEAASVSIQLRISGTPYLKETQIPAHGVLRADVGTYFELGDSPDAAAVGTVLVESDQEIGGLALVRKGKDLFALGARPQAPALKTLVLPQFAVLGPFRSTLNLTNEGAEPVILTITAYRPDGQRFTAPALTQNPVTKSLDAAKSDFLDVATLFGFSGDALLDGWLKVESTAATVQGTLVYELPELGSLAAVSALPSGLKEALFSHVATDLGFFTGLAILNPGSISANIRVVAFHPEGSVVGTYSSTLRPGERISKLITELIPRSDHMAGGFIWLSSDVPVYSVSIFGSIANGILANVEAQPIPLDPGLTTGQPSLQVKPPLAVLPPGGQISFQASGFSGTPAWKVNGLQGDDAETVGKVDSSGSYHAPSTVPQTLPLTVTAGTAGKMAGASIDVIEKNLLLSGLGVIQSVTYLASLKRLYTAELTGAPAVGDGPVPAAGTESVLYEIEPGARRPVKSFPGEEVSQIIPFQDRYLLIAGRTTGTIFRFDPANVQTVTVTSGLDRPAAMVLESGSGDLLVAEANRVSRIPAWQLGPSAMALSTGRTDRRLYLLEDLPLTSGPAGMSYSECSESLYLSFPEEGTVVELSPLTGYSRTVADGLNRPGPILGLYRSGVSCPDAFQLLVSEENARLSSLVPSSGQQITWEEETNIRSLSFLPAGNPFGVPDSIVSAELSGSAGDLSLFKVPQLYTEEASNPAQSGQRGVTIELSSCSGLNTPYATYLLQKDLSGDAVTPECMHITANHITLDCQGHSLRNPALESTAVVYSSGDYTTVRNCVLTASAKIQDGGDSAGIRLNGAYGLVEFNTVQDTFWGIQITGHDNVLRHNVVERNAKGIHLEGDRNVVKNNLSRQNTLFQSWGMGVWNGSGNLFLNNRAHGNRFGLVLKNADFTVVQTCDVLEGQIYLYSDTEGLSYRPCDNTECNWVGDICEPPVSPALQLFSNQVR